MFQDARELDDQTELEADVCIIGAGAAGTTLTTELARHGHKVLLIESGGLSYGSRVQSLYAGRLEGLLYEPLDLCRVRTFGGSTDARGWGGWCKPLADIDFEKRSWVPLSGWPIERRDLDDYYRRAYRTLSLPDNTELQATRDAARDDVLQFQSQYCKNEPCALSPAPELGKVSMDAIGQAQNVTALLHANAIEIVTNEAANHIEAVRIATLDNKSHVARARFIVLATGGIENARLLLSSDRVQKEGLGNASGFVGRCFMEHPRYSWGRLSPEDLATRLPRYNPGTAVFARKQGRSQTGTVNTPIFGASLALTEKAQREFELLGARTWIVPVSGTGDRDAGREFKELVFWLKKRRIPSDTIRRIKVALGDLPNAIGAVSAHLMAKVRPPTDWQFITVLEQEPNPSSRVRLDQDRDALGMRCAVLNWQIGDLTKRTLIKTRELFARELQASGLECAVEANPNRPTNQNENEPRWVWHHMGTTRMSADEKEGVVDRDCKVHGVANLFIGGSSVFPTVGNDMPTLTVVALAHRMADHLNLQIRAANQPADALANGSARHNETAVSHPV
ncbi:MAG: GMC family oxidoreductase [Pseudomonadota bacterium]